MSHDPYDLTQHAPRSPRVRLGGLVIVPRMLDKCRASLKGKAGDYEYGCSLDRYVLDFLGIDAEALRAQVATGKGDGELLAWLRANARHPRLPHEIEAFSAWHERRAPTTAEKRAKMSALQDATPAGAARDDIASWFDLLDLDDHASFGGRI
jgi:hypothetical protein